MVALQIILQREKYAHCLEHHALTSEHVNKIRDLKVLIKLKTCEQNYEDNSS